MANGSMKILNNQNGIALVTVILVTSLVAILAVSMTFAQHIDIRRTTNLMEGDKAMVLALGLEEWGRKVLERDRERGEESDNLGEDWAFGLIPTATANGVISGIIIDLQSRINLNNLIDADRDDQTKEFLMRLFDFCQVDDSYVLVQSLTDWLDDDETTLAYGAEDSEYLLHDPAYLAGNQLMVSPTELLLVEGITPDNYVCIENHISTLLGATNININTVGPVVISTFSNDISIDEANEIVKARPDNGYADVIDFISDVQRLAGTVITADGLTLYSGFFMVQGKAVFGEAEIGLYSLVDKSSFLVKVLGRSIGTY